MSNNPASQNYFGYNYDHITTDFEYLDLASEFGSGWTFDTKLYTYAYSHQGYNGEDPNGTFPNQVVLTYGGAPQSGVPGQILQNDYRSVGTITRVTKDFDFGDVKFGIWYDHQFNTRSLIEVDMSGQSRLPNFDPNNGGGAIRHPARNTRHQCRRRYRSVADTDVADHAALSAGGLERDGRADALARRALFVVRPQRQRAGRISAAQTRCSTYTTTPTPRCSRPSKRTTRSSRTGRLMRRSPKASLRPTKSSSTIRPRISPTSRRKTRGTIKSGQPAQFNNLAVSADAYYIKFSNFYQTKSFGGISGPISLGGVDYKGLEGELTYLIGGGFSAYASGSLNDAKQTDKAAWATPNGWISGTPEDTWVVGGIFNRDGFYASLLGKYTGARPGDEGLGSGSPFFTIDGSVDYDISHVFDVVKNAHIKVDVQNLTNVTKIIYNSGSTLEGQNLYWTEPGRSVFVTLSTTF